MANDTIFQQPQAEKKRSGFAQMIGGSFEDVYETLTGTGTGFVNEGPVSRKDYENTEIIAKNPIQGSLSEFQTPRSKEDVFRQQIKTEQEISTIQGEKQVEKSLEEKRMEIAQLNGLQLDFKGVMDASGKVNEYHEANAERKNAENLASKIKQGKEQMITQATGKGVSRIAGADIKRNFEDQNMQNPG